jgi:two-component system, OmpR family, response regulator VicR
MSKKILIVDDEKVIIDILKFNLKRDGYDVIEAYDGEQAVERALNESPDMILLDIMIPKMDGYAVCIKLRETITTPIIMLTAKDDEIDRVLGLELGADDFITKPFSYREVLARVKANLRRVINEEFLNSTGSVLKCDRLFIDLDKNEVKYDGVVINFNQREFELLKFLALNRGQVFKREEIIEKIWKKHNFRDVRIVNATIARIKRKLEKDYNNPRYIMKKQEFEYYFSK